jgi:DNA-binding CsgD family transcriptional regulator
MIDDLVVETSRLVEEHFPERHVGIGQTGRAQFAANTGHQPSDLPRDAHPGLLCGRKVPALVEYRHTDYFPADVETCRVGGADQPARGVPRERADRGWASLTPTERDVVRLVSDGLGNKDIATRLFVSPRTVQTHLTHVYTKLGLTSRVQLAQEAARHT